MGTYSNDSAFFEWVSMVLPCQQTDCSFCDISFNKRPISTNIVRLMTLIIFNPLFILQWQTNVALSHSMLHTAAMYQPLGPLYLPRYIRASALGGLVYEATNKI